MEPCEACRGACCERFVLNAAASPSMREFLGVRFRETAQPWVFEVDARCPKLSPMGACSIYERRPSVCRDYPVASPACIAAIESRRGRDVREWILSLMNERGIFPTCPVPSVRLSVVRRGLTAHQ